MHSQRSEARALSGADISLTSTALGGLDGAVFTPPEQQVCARLVFGESNADIGYSIGRSEKTVKAHLTKIMQKIGATNRTEAALILAGVLQIKQGERANGG